MTPRRTQRNKALSRVISGTFFTLFSLFLFASFVQADVLAKFRVKDFQGELHSKPGAAEGSYVFLLTALEDRLAGELRAKTFALVRPTRLVVDVPGFAAKRNDIIPLHHPRFTGIRIGRHPDKVRIVLDIKGDTKPDFVVRAFRKNNTLSIDFGFTDQFAGSVEKVEPRLTTSVEPLKPKQPVVRKPVSPPIVRLPEPPEVIGPDVDVADAGESDERRLATLLGEDSVKKPTPDALVSLFQGYMFNPDLTGSELAFLIKTERLSDFSLTRRKESNIYELVLKNTRLQGPHLELPHFPPDNYEGLEVIVAEQRGVNVVLKIYVEDRIRLSPLRSKGKLWIKVAE